jgi:hypothetical protein
MTRDDLFRGLLAALREKGIQFIDTRNDDHHSRFQSVVDVLTAERNQFPDIPSTFVPSPFTGRYREFDDALLRLQRGLLGAQNPFYPGVNLDITLERAHKILQGYREEEKELFSRLASAYRGEESMAERAS